MKELLDAVIKHLPGYLSGIMSLVTGPKTTIVRWVYEQNGDFTRPIIFVALSVAFGFLLQIPQISKNPDSVMLVVGMAVYKILAIVLFAAIIHWFLRVVRGHASFAETCSAYLYLISPLYIVLVVLHMAAFGILQTYDPVVAIAAILDPSYMSTNSEQWRVFMDTAPKLAVAYNLMNFASAIVLIGWFIVCWGAFRRLHGVTFWGSVLAGIATFVVGIIFFTAMNYVELDMFGPHGSQLR